MPEVPPEGEATGEDRAEEAARAVARGVAGLGYAPAAPAEARVREAGSSGFGQDGKGALRLLCLDLEQAAQLAHLGTQG